MMKPRRGVEFMKVPEDLARTGKVLAELCCAASTVPRDNERTNDD